MKMNKAVGDKVLELKGITKRFPGVLANDHVDLDLYKGEILALLGENGAGKIKGEKIELEGPRDAIDHGIGMVHQHFQLVPVMTVAENVVLGSETVRALDRLDQKLARQKVHDLSQQYGLEVEPRAVIEDLPVGMQQRVEIIKALYRKADILILDEPTAVLTPQEANELFRVMRDLTARGVSIIFITHKLKEVLAVADRIGVLRRGRMVGTVMPDEATERSLAELMVGREVILQVDKSAAHPGKAMLEVRGLTVNDDRHQIAVDDLSLEVRSGEILGVAGVQGNGQRELVEALTGLRPVVSGEFAVDGESLTGSTPRKITELGVAHIPEDREKHGLVMAYSIADNMVLNRYYEQPYSHRGILNHRAIERHGIDLVAQYDVRTPSVLNTAGSLSGGNKQKVIVAREFSRPVKLLIASQPTRGLDVGSIEFIHSQLIKQRDNGVAVLLVSAELDEILSLSDRIAVIFDGKIVKTLPAAEADREYIGLLMAGSEA
jgi:simple sugar transport system ATP-binding protein